MNTDQPRLTVDQIRLYYQGNLTLGCFDTEAAEQYWRDIPSLLTHIQEREEQFRKVLQKLKHEAESSVVLERDIDLAASSLGIDLD